MSHFFYKHQSAEVNLELGKKTVSFINRSMILILVLFLMIVALYPQLILSYDLGFASSEEDNIAQMQLEMAVKETTPKLVYYSYNFFFNWLRWLIPIAIIFKIFASRRIKGITAILFSIIVILLSAMLGTDYRAASVFLLISLFLILVKLYPSHKKALFMICVGSFSFIGIVGLIYKSYGVENASDIDLQGMANMLQSYFSGPDNVAIGLMIPDNPSFKTFIGDIFGFIPYVMYFFQGYETSMVQFNYVFFHEADITTQILPMICQGERYFTFIGAPIFTYLVCKLAFKLEIRSLTAQSIIEYSKYIMICVFLPFSVSMYCASQLITIFFSIFFPTILLLRYSEKVCAGKVKSSRNSFVV